RPLWAAPTICRFLPIWLMAESFEGGDMANIGIQRDELLGPTPFSDLNSDERRYSVHIRDTIMKVLRGESDRLDVMTRYHRESNRLGAIPMPPGVDPTQVRMSKVDEILSCSLRFLHDGSEGGPIAQWEEQDKGIILQRRDFPTRFPHIVIERTDSYDRERGEPIQTRWRVHRLQNQRHNIRVNRILDAVNLGIDLLRYVR
ncbi:MAG TPA: hypothetical protein VHS28_04860, partial [Chloroflexota bacterium]|nr:hypothetical protein [Chloroflexota bacterium]